MRKIIAAALLLTVILLSGFAVYRSSAYQGCISEQSKAGEQQQNKSHSLFVVVIYVDCLGPFFRENHGPITGLSTLFIALFTLTLWWSTRGLLRATNETIKLARDEFIATHRPKIIVYGFDIQFRSSQNDESAPVHFRYVNIGDSAAFVVEIGTLVEKLSKPMLGPGADFKVTRMRPPLEVKSGGHGFKMTDDKADLFTVTFSDLGGDGGVVCVGYIAYTDASGTIRQTGFCRKYDSESHRWSKVEDEDYEYAY